MLTRNAYTHVFSRNSLTYSVAIFLQALRLWTVLNTKILLQIHTFSEIAGVQIVVCYQSPILI